MNLADLAAEIAKCPGNHRPRPTKDGIAIAPFIPVKGGGALCSEDSWLRGVLGIAEIWPESDLPP